VKRHETLDPARSDAVDPRFHGVGSRPIVMINVNWPGIRCWWCWC